MEQKAYSIPQFCALHGFSRASYYKLPQQKRPREMRVGNRVLITVEAATDWRRAREAEASDITGGSRS